MLEPLQVAGRRVDYYADPKIDGRKFDLMVLDGPTAFDFRSRYNRLGFLRHLDAIGEDFIIIVDDVERPGEQRLVSEITRALRQRGSTFRSGQTVAAKIQEVIAGGAFLRAAYF